MLTYDVLYVINVEQGDVFQCFHDWGSTLPFGGRCSKPETLTNDVLYVEQDDAFQCFHDWGRLSTASFWGRHSKPEILTYDVLDVRKDDAFQRCLGAFVDA